MSHFISPGFGSHRKSAAVISRASDAQFNALDTEGTIDWVFLGDQATFNIPLAMGAQNPARNPNGTGELWRNFSWVSSDTGWSAFNQGVGRFFTSAAANNARGDALSSDNGVGFFANASNELNGCGFQLQIPAVRQRRRLKLYTSSWECSVKLRAWVLNEDFQDGQDLYEVSELEVVGLPGVTWWQAWVVDFVTQTSGTLYVEYVVSNQITVNSNIKVQAFTLAPTP